MVPSAGFKADSICSAAMLYEGFMEHGSRIVIVTFNAELKVMKTRPTLSTNEARQNMSTKDEGSSWRNKWSSSGLGK